NQCPWVPIKPPSLLPESPRRRWLESPTRQSKRTTSESARKSSTRPSLRAPDAFCRALEPWYSPGSWFQLLNGTIHGADDVADLLVREMRTDRQAQNGVRQSFGDRKRTAAQFFVRISAGQMGWHGIVNQCANAGCGELLLQGIAFRMAND